MAVVRLQFEIDRDIYPELYATLSALSGAGARAERLRQLAASGLVWENVRIYGAATIGPSMPPIQAALAVAEPATPVAVKRTRRATSSKAVPPVLERRADPRGPDFVDLAIDATPKPHLPRHDVHAREDIARELPVLMDVVMDEVNESAEERETEPEPEHELTIESISEPQFVPALSHQPAKQSRLMRMKERGLFKNG